MRNVFDHLGRTIGVSALSPCGLTVAEDILAPDARRADLRHEPDPARAEERARLGLLGRIASVLCLIEIYSSAPDEDDALACAGKLIAFRQQRRREARKKQKEMEKKLGRKLPPEPFVRPFGWILTAGCPASVLSGIGATQATGWPPGIYFSPGILSSLGDIPSGLDRAGGMFRMGIVVASELPRDRSTLLVRFMAAGPLLADAIADLAALPEGAHERGVAEEILVGLQHALGKKTPSPTPEEEEFIVNILSTFAKEREMGRAEGEATGEAKGEARALMAALRVRGIPVPEAARERILAEKDPARLERWIERAIFAASVDEVMGDPSQAA